MWSTAVAFFVARICLGIFCLEWEEKHMKRASIVLIMTILVAGIGMAAEFSTNPNSTGQSASFPGLAPGPNSITQNTDPITIATGSVSCNAGGLHTDNSYMRRFILDVDHGIVNQFDVESVDVGVETAAGATGSQPIEIRLYSILKADPLLLANLTQVGVLVTTVADTSATIENFVVTGSIIDPTTHDLVVEVFTPEGQTDGNSFFIGSNAAGQIGPSYLAAADCGVTEPTDTAVIGFPDMHIVMTVHGTELPVELMSFSIE